MQISNFAFIRAGWVARLDNLIVIFHLMFCDLSVKIYMVIILMVTS